MHFSTLSFLTTASFITSTLSHGLIQVPASRPVGSQILANCGSGVTNQIKSDNTSHIEGLPEAAAKDKSYNPALCNLWLCKGLQYADNTANVQTFTPGQNLAMKVWIRIPHKGTANVSIVDTKTNTIIGSPLKSWDDYADGALESQVAAGDKQFNVTIPTTLPMQCMDAGNCVLQWWWYGTQAKQTYASCVDFKYNMPMKSERAWTA